ncbi:GTP cyclohydrolase II [Alphaproteobacteria bacterium]|nr:GTP cyclohydrolase II [Alphaproteobacteria bacterium]
MSLNKNTGILIDRAINELRTGRPIVLEEKGNFWIFYNIEHSTKNIINQFKSIQEKETFLLITKQKAKQLLPNKLNTNIFFQVSSNFNHAKFQDLFLNPADKNNILNLKDLSSNKSKSFHNYALELSKNAKLIPSLIFKKIKTKLNNNIDNILYDMGLLKFKYSDLVNQNKHISDSIKLVSSANVPLPYVEDSSFKIFKSYIGSQQHMAIIINPTKIKKTANLRIHSACFTGDIFHSLKCDCGEQLNNSTTYMAKNNGGIILYLDQEGRGIGLANKMRAYSLQSRGLDTIDADHNIGFLDDERDFNVASKILSLLNIKNVNIITNNPLKMSAIKKAGVKIVNQINTKPTINKHNKNYFKTRVKKTSYRLKIAV